jgi:hypothetical protein
MANEQLDEFLSRESEAADEPSLLSRRRFLTGTVAGGAAGLAVAAGTGVAVWKVTDAELLAAKEAAEAELQAAAEAADAEIARLQGLVRLYENLEKIGLDAVIETGMAAVALPLAGVEVGAKALKSGLDGIEKALLSLEEALPTAQESILWLEARVSALAEGIEKLETALGRALETAGSTAVVEALRDFASMILDNLPFGLGDKIRGVLEGLVTVVTSVDELVEGVNTFLLEPLRENWFATEDGQGIEVSLVNPLVEKVLDPLEAHLIDLAVLADTWQNKLMAPAEEALAKRAQLRQEIAQYRSRRGFD